MMSLSDIRDLVASLFIMLNKEKFILFRIELLVVIVTVLFLAMFIMDIFRRYIHSSIMKAIFSIFDAVSDSIIIYLLGAMQTAPFKNQLLPVWALVLVIFRYSIDFISGYGIPDRGGRRFTEWRNVVKLLGSAFLNWSRGSSFARPLWSLWALQILRSAYRLISRDLAFRSYWHGGSSELISEYMGADHGPSKWKAKEFNPGTMEGYKYLVCEERVKLRKPRYVLHIKTTSTPCQEKKNTTPTHRPSRKTMPGRHLSAQGEDTTSSNTITRSSPITLDKIWGCSRHLLHANSQGKDLKDLSLAFALSRLLRCRLEDVTLEGDILQINRKLVKRTIIEEKDTKCAFGLMEMQVAFVNDYFNTRYPMVFWHGLWSLFFSLLQSVVAFGIVCWLSVDIRSIYKPPESELAHLVEGVNVDMIITWTFMSFMMFKEIWEIVTYLLSDWTRVLLVCMYAKWDNERVRNCCMERLILSFFKSKITAKRWHGLIDQYVFVQSYDDIPRFWNLLHMVTTGMVPKKDDGAKLSSAIKIPEYVRQAVLEKLRAILEEPAVPNRNFEEQEITGRRHLPKVITTLSDINGHRRELYGWACFDLPTSSHVILVWHIATSLCEMELAKKQGVNLRNLGFLRSLLSCFTDCCSSKSYLINVDEKKKEKRLAKYCGIHLYLSSLLSWFTNCCSSKSTEKEKDTLTDKVQERYITANSLSRYCAYLLVSKPDLIPDRFLVPKMVLQTTVRSARDDILKDCDSLQSRYDELKNIGEKAAKDSDNVKKSEDVVKQGAMLGQQLSRENLQDCWEILAGVWAELLVHIAPTWHAEAHKKCLESGGEFITHIWALLWHCGIEKSTLWPGDDASESNASVAPRDNNIRNNKVQSVDEEQKANTDMNNHQIEIHEEDAIEGTKKPEAGNFRRRARGVGGTGSSTEGASRDATVEAANVHTYMQNKSEAKKVEQIVPVQRNMN